MSTGEVAMGNEFQQWADSLATLLVELAAQEFEYPIGVNEVRPPTVNKAPLPATIEPLYRVCDGVSLPDVHVGYFIDSAARLGSAPARGEPTRIGEGENSIPILTFGSDGGGNRFALSLADGTTYYLPSGGAVRDGIFLQDDAVKARRIADSLINFLDLLLGDVRAFVQGDENHHYLPEQ